MKRMFFVTLGLGMILNVATASAQGYPFGSGNTDMPWSVNQQSTADPRQDRAAQSQASPIAQEQQGKAASRRLAALAEGSGGSIHPYPLRQSQGLAQVDHDLDTYDEGVIHPGPRMGKPDLIGVDDVLGIRN